MNKKTLGVFMTMCAAIMFGINPSVQNFLLLAHISPIGCTCFTILAATILLFLCCVVTKTSLRLTKEQCLPIFLCGICSFLTDWLLEVSYTMIPVGYATMIHFLYPTLICITMTLLFHESITRYKRIAICLSLGGLVLISGGGGELQPLGIVFAFLTALAYASFLMMADKTSLRELPSLTFSFYANLLCLGFCFILLIVTKSSIPTSPTHFGFVLISAILLACATYFQNKGVKYLGSSSAALISIVEPLASVVVSVFFFAYELPFFCLIGCLLIIISLFFAK